MKKYTVAEYQKLLDQFKMLRFAGLKKYDAWHYIAISAYRYMYLPHDDDHTIGFAKRVRIAILLVLRALWTLLLRGYCLEGIEKAEHKTILFLSDYYMSRRDMNTTMQTVSASSDAIVMVRAEKKKKIRLNPKYFFLVTDWVLKINKLQIAPDLKYLLMKTVADTYLFHECIRKNAKAILKVNALLSLNDENFTENILMQFCHRHGIPTATLQHGHFWNTKNSDELIWYAHNFKNLLADYFFAWGQYTCDLAVKDGVSPDRLIPVGIPKYIGITEKLPLNHNKVFGVFFDTVSIGSKTNLDLARFANSLSEAYGYSFWVKLHPTDSAERYKDIFNSRFIGFAEPMSVLDFSKKIDFSLLCASTVFFEQILFGKPSFRYSPSDLPDYFEGLDFSAFSDEKQLKDIVEFYLHDEEGYLCQYKALSDYCCGAGSIEENYRQAIHRLNSLKSIK